MVIYVWLLFPVVESHVVCGVVVMNGVQSGEVDA